MERYVFTDLKDWIKKSGRKPLLLRGARQVGKTWLAEQFVGQEIVSVTKNQLYYWARDAKNSNAEIDYLLLSDGKLIPIEVKDGPSGKLRSLHLYRDNYNPPLSVVFHAGQTGVLEKEKIVFLPLYFAGAFTRFGINID